MIKLLQGNAVEKHFGLLIGEFKALHPQITSRLVVLGSFCVFTFGLHSPLSGFLKCGLRKLTYFLWLGPKRPAVQSLVLVIWFYSINNPLRAFSYDCSFLRLFDLISEKF